LYDIDLPDWRMTGLLDALMRGYPGIFSFPLPVDESSLARDCGVQVPQLRVLLYNLSLEHVIRYIPADHSSVIFLHHDRLRPGNVALSPEKYRLLKETYHERMSAMENYVSEVDECRAQFLLRYFGQSESEPCGTCDICRSGAARRTDPRAATERWLREEVASRGGSYTLDDLRTAFESRQLSLSPDWPSILRSLIDTGELPPPSL
jgi:ATP-dependent DNA helicase RecQ